MRIKPQAIMDAFKALRVATGKSTKQNLWCSVPATARDHSFPWNWNAWILREVTAGPIQAICDS